jgi:uncharacterized membrane protein (UPF0182 family)
VRNSVKATIDAYDGTIKFYVVDTKDPIIRTYRKAFPQLFSDVSAMPAELRQHWRYPEDLFNAQTEQYALYHITDPVQYFNKQDIWDIAPAPEQATAAAVTTPQQGGNNGGRNTTLAATGDASDPLYLTLQLPNLPGAHRQEFTLQRSFTPRRQGGILSSFIFARTDGDNYGQLVVYSVADASAPSGAKAATAIESDQFISSQFTLLGQAGSKVERGAVQLIPIGDAVLYVRPIWVTGQGPQPYPRFRFLAGVAGDRAVLGCDVTDAVNALLSGDQTRLQKLGTSACGRPETTTPGGPPPLDGTTTTTTPSTTPGTGTQPAGNATVDQLLADAKREFQAADAALARGDLGEFQRHVKRAQDDVDRATALRAGSSSTTTTRP